MTEMTNQRCKTEDEYPLLENVDLKAMRDKMAEALGRKDVEICSFSGESVVDGFMFQVKVKVK